MEQKIVKVAPGSLGEELGFEPGDVLLKINGQEIEDVLDYYYLTDDTALLLEVRTKQGEVTTVALEKDAEEPLGLSFEEEFMGKYRHCKNKCVFCFIDQLPPGMRDTLYFKDDDARLSFLNGNYITMTNMAEQDFEKILRYHMSPMNVSVHTTNPELRVKMLKNPSAGELMPKLKRLAENGITLNGQIVLCKGLNDGEELIRTIRDLGELVPAMQSLSIVPVGLSRFREGLYPLEPFTAEDARELIETIRPIQREFYEKTGLHFVHLSDEFYCLSGEALPEEESYDGYLQIENGVGMMRLFVNEAEAALAKAKPKRNRRGKLTVVTGLSAEPFIRELAQKAQAFCPKREIEVVAAVNHFFGPMITVTGLLTGRDLIDQLKERELGDAVLLPGNLLRAGADHLPDADGVFLDDVTLKEFENALQTPVFIVKSSGEEFVKALLEGKPARKRTLRKNVK